MGILSCPDDPAVAAVAADSVTEEAAGASIAAEATNTSVPSGTTELDATEPCPHLDASDEVQQAPPTWGACASEKQNPSEVKGEGSGALDDQCISGKDERHLQRHHDEAEGSLKKEGSPECAECGKDQPEVGSSQEGKAGMCETCRSKAQTGRMQDELQGEETFGHNPQMEVSSVAPALEDTEGPHHRGHGPAEEGDETSAKIPGASRGSSSSSSGGSGSGTASNRLRGSSAAAGVASAAGAATAASAAAPRKCIDEGSVRRHVVPVGPRHQVPCLPPFFLENSGFGCCCGEPSPALDPSLTAKLVYSPSSLERVRQRRLAEGLADRAICTEGDMEAFMQQCAKNWKGNKPGWQPFSPEFAFKLLHYAGYDPAKALQLMEDPQFSFQLVCDGPVRRYDNKWRPKDRRGVIAPTPCPRQCS